MIVDAYPEGQAQPREHTFWAISHPALMYQRRHAGSQGSSGEEDIPSHIDPLSNVSRSTYSGGKIFHFNFGAIASVNATKQEIERELAGKFGALSGDGESQVEEFVVYEDPGQKPSVGFSRMVLDQMTPEREEVVALTLGQSAAMEYYEHLCDGMWRELEMLMDRLRRRGTVSPYPGKLHKKIAQIISARGSVVGVLHMLDRPDLIWDDPVMDHLYNDLRAMFDLPERFQALEYKLGLIQDTLEVLLDTARDRRSFWMEMAIVLFFAVDIVFTLLHEFPSIGQFFRSIF